LVRPIVAIHPGRVAVGEEQAVGNMEGCVYGILPIRRDIHPKTEIFQHATDHPLIHPILSCPRTGRAKMRSDDLSSLLLQADYISKLLFAPSRVVIQSLSYKMGVHIAAHSCFSTGYDKPEG
jgi:hypothetical protein